MLFSFKNQVKLFVFGAIVLVIWYVYDKGDKAIESVKPQLVIDAGMHTGPIRGLAVDAAEQVLVTASEDKTFRVWRLPNLTLVKTLRPPMVLGNAGKPYGLALSPDGAQAVCGGWTSSEFGGTAQFYVFNIESGEITQVVSDLPNAITHMAFSPDGGHLVVCLDGTNGIRAYETGTWALTQSDFDYDDRCNFAAFDAKGRWVTSCDDGFLRLYDSNLSLVLKQTLPGRRPHGLSFSPDGQELAVGFNDSAVIVIVSGEDLVPRLEVDHQGLSNGALSSVCWARDGKTLYAGGSFEAAGDHPILAWSEAGRGPVTQLPGSHAEIQGLYSATDGSLYFGAADPALGKLDETGARVMGHASPIADFRAMGSSFQVDDTGLRVRFSYGPGKPALFDVGQGQLVLDPGPGSEHAALSEAEGLELVCPLGTVEPKVLGRFLPLYGEKVEVLAVQAGGSHFLIGTETLLRYYDRLGLQIWSCSIPGTPYAVNLTADGSFAVAAYSDGTVRWYWARDGELLLSLFPHADQKRWVAWTQSGYYASSEDGESLVGWHVNGEGMHGAEFFPAEHFNEIYHRPDAVKKILRMFYESDALKPWLGLP